MAVGRDLSQQGELVTGRDYIDNSTTIRVESRRALVDRELVDSLSEKGRSLRSYVDLALLLHPIVEDCGSLLHWCKRPDSELATETPWDFVSDILSQLARACNAVQSHAQAFDVQALVGSWDSMESELDEHQGEISTLLRAVELPEAKRLARSLLRTRSRLLGVTSEARNTCSHGADALVQELERCRTDIFERLHDRRSPERERKNESQVRETDDEASWLAPVMPLKSRLGNDDDNRN
jgi:hypothetical protein